MQRRLELISAHQMAIAHHSAGGESQPLEHFMVVTPKYESELSLEDAMSQWD